MKECIKFVNDDYQEIVCIDDGAEVPAGFKPLIPLSDGSDPVPGSSAKYVKLLIQEDAVFFKLLDSTDENSSGNVRIINLTKPWFYVEEIDPDLSEECPGEHPALRSSEQRQEETRQFLQGIASTEVNSGLQKALECAERDLSKQ